VALPVTALLLALLTIVVSTNAWAQAATEVHIPIGRSPGVSGVTSVIGTVESVDPFTVAGRTFELTDRTIVYLDRNKLQRTNSVGVFGSIELGDFVEVRPLSRQPSVADWVKVEVTR